MTTGIHFPTPFHTYKVSSWMHHPSYKPPGLGCRYQRRSTRLFLSLGVARTGLRRNPFSCQCIPAHYAVGCLRRTSRTYRTLPQEAYTCSCSSRHWKMHSPTPLRFRGFFSSATPPFRPANREPHTTVHPKTYLCGSHGDATRCCELFTGLFLGRDLKLARGVPAGHDNLLE